MSELIQPLALFAREMPWAFTILGTVGFCIILFVGWSLVPNKPPPLPRPPMPPDSLLEAMKRDRRSAYRREGNAILVYLARGDPVPRLGWIKDRSRGGMCLLADAPMEVGSRWYVRAESAPEEIPWIAVEIRGSTRVKNDWEIRCRFLETPRWNILLYFG
jgi:hypothetical protein